MFMKLQVSFDVTDLDRALTLARSIESHTDIFEIGSLLIYKHGENALKKFREAFPQKTLLVDAKIVDRSKDAVTLFAQDGADWITVMAGVNKAIIHAACTTAHGLGKKIMLDLADASSLGQSALEAKSLGVDALLFNTKASPDEQTTFLDRWEMVRGNTQLPIFVSGGFTAQNIEGAVSLGAEGVIVGSSALSLEEAQNEIATLVSLIRHS